MLQTIEFGVKMRFLFLLIIITFFWRNSGAGEPAWKSRCVDAEPLLHQLVIWSPEGLDRLSRGEEAIGMRDSLLWRGVGQWAKDMMGEPNLERARQTAWDDSLELAGLTIIGQNAQLMRLLDALSRGVAAGGAEMDRLMVQKMAVSMQMRMVRLGMDPRPHAERGLIPLGNKK